MKDKAGRLIDYLRISITDRCNLRCSYCMPEEGVKVKGHDEILRYEELARLARVAAGIGFRHFRITGGEPLARKGSVEFITGLARDLRSITGADLDLAMTTNGVLLAPVAGQLRAGGLQRVNISLDTLDPRKYHAITRRDAWSQAWAGIEAAIAVGFQPVKLNIVLVRGMNDDEILQFGALAAGRPLHVRFIELMPLGEGCHTGGGPVPSDEVLAVLAAGGQLEQLAGQVTPTGAGPASVYRWRGGAGTIGVIPALTHKFCTDCNRLRLTADGRLHPCLASPVEVDLRGAMRAGATDSELAGIFTNAVQLKPLCHHMDEQSELDTGASKRMYRIGG